MSDRDDVVVIAGRIAIGALGECLAGEIPQSAGWSSSIGIGILVFKAQIRLLERSPSKL